MEEIELKKVIEEIKEKLSNLKLEENLKVDELEKFYLRIIPTLKRYNYEINIDRFYEFAKYLKLSNEEMIAFIKENPQVITEIGFNSFIEKYIFLSVVENETNTQRLRHMKKTPRDFKSGLSALYSKYFYLKEYGIETNWSSLIRQKQEKIDKKIKSSGETPLTIESIKQKYPLDKSYIEELKKLAINNFGVLNEEKSRSK